MQDWAVVHVRTVTPMDDVSWLGPATEAQVPPPSVVSRKVALPEASIPRVAHVSASTQASGVAPDNVTGRFDGCQVSPPSWVTSISP